MNISFFCYEFIDSIVESQAKYWLKSLTVQLFRKRVKIGKTRIIPFWTNDSEWHNFPYVCVFMMENYWDQLFDNRTDINADDFASWRVQCKLFSAILANQFDSREFIVKDEIIEPTPYLVVGFKSESDIMSLKLMYSELPIWTRYTIKQFNYV